LVGAPPHQAVSPDDACFNRLTGLHHGKQRDHAVERKIDVLDRCPRFVEHGVVPQLHWNERMQAFEFVSRKLP
jgi:hypothetical protein